MSKQLDEAARSGTSLNYQLEDEEEREHEHEHEHEHKQEEDIEHTEADTMQAPRGAFGWRAQAAAGAASRRRAPILPKKLARERSSSSWLLSLVVVFMSYTLNAIGATNGQCPERTMTSFERISGVAIKDAPLTILYQANMSQATIGHHQHQNGSLVAGPAAAAASSSSSSSSVFSSSTTLYQISTPITAECNNRCRKSKNCRAFLVDYGRHTCWSVDSHPPLQAQSGSPSGSSHTQLAFSLLDRAPTPIHLVPTGERTAYFEKVCINLPIVECERAWNFERVLSHHIYGHDDKIIDDVPSRLKCQEHCLNERQFRCRSGEYDHLSMQCRLSLVDRHMKPSLFRPTSTNIDYFENQCAASANQCDSFERYEDMDLGRAEIMRLANSSEQCQQFCTQTIKAFMCRSFTWSPLTGRCYLNSANTFMVGGLDKLLAAPGLVYYQRTDCIDLKLDCDTNSMTLNLRTNEPFRGRMYVRDDPSACETLGRSALLSSLSIPFHSQMGARCAQREMPSRYSSVVVVQQHPLIQRKSDRYIKLVCDFQTSNKTITSHYNVMANPWTSTALINATSFAPKILLRITDKFGNDITGAKLGDELQLRIEAETDSIYDMVARSVLAKSGTTDESIVLIDRDGCPADFRIFPPLRKLNKRTIIGRFDAFKFSSDVVVRFQVDVQFCLNSCPPTNCLEQQQNQLFNVNPQQLAPSSSEAGVQPLPSGAESSSLDEARLTASSSGSSSLSSTSTSTSTSTTSSPLLSSSNPRLSPTERADYSLPPDYARSTTGAPTNRQQQQQQQQQQDYVSSLSGNSLLDYPSQDSAMVPSRPQQAPANQPLAGGYAPSQSAPSDQLFDPARPRSMPAGGGGGGEQHQAPSSKQHHTRHSTTGGKQRPAYESNQMLLQQVDQLAGSELIGQEQDRIQPQDQNSHRSKRRRRRSAAEQIPASPKYVPLQREIIVIESPSGGQEQEKKRQDERQQKSFLQTAGQRHQAAGANRQAHKQKHAEGNSIDGSKYELNLLMADQQANSRAANLADLADDTRAQLVCTSRTSLVFFMLTFGALQLLTLGICLAGWLNRRRSKSIKQVGSTAAAAAAAGAPNFTGRLQPNVMHASHIQVGRRLF